jgi:glycosyltransferase involved in cell wall biosynthesis
MWGRHVPYKRFDLGIEACNKLQLPLTISGTGPETKRLQKIAGPSVHFIGRASDKEIVRLAHSCEALLFPGEEDSGLVPVEAMSAGLPVVAYGKGGALDYVVDGKTGILFKHQTVNDLVRAIQRFQKTKFNSTKIHEHSRQFSDERFVEEVRNFVAKKSKR